MNAKSWKAAALTVLSLAALLSSSCTRAGNVTEGLNGCDWTRSILVSRDDALTEGTASQILAYNRTRERLCGGEEKP